MNQLLSLSDEEFVPSCYRALLFREADAAGLAHYVAKVAAGDDRLALAAAIASSEEAAALHFSKKKLIGAVLAQHGAKLITAARTKERRAKAARRISAYMSVLAGAPVSDSLRNPDPFKDYLENVIGSGDLPSSAARR